MARAYRNSRPADHALNFGRRRRLVGMTYGRVARSGSSSSRCLKGPISATFLLTPTRRSSRSSVSSRRRASAARRRRFFCGSSRSSCRVGKEVDESPHSVDARLADGSRVKPWCRDRCGRCLCRSQISKVPIRMESSTTRQVPPESHLILNGIVKLQTKRADLGRDEDRERPPY